MSDNTSIYLLVFVAGLTGGFGHCVGMCGPIIITFSIKTGKKILLHNIFYNLGRITTYIILVGIVGLTGSLISLSNTFKVFQKTIMLIMGIVIILGGIKMIGWIPLVHKIKKGLGEYRIISRLIRTFLEDMTPGRYFPLGIILGFLPCGLVYSILISAGSIGMNAKHPLVGLVNSMFLMLIFGIGTVPSLLLVGHVSSLLTKRLKESMYRISAYIMIIIGIIFTLRAIFKF